MVKSLKHALYFVHVPKTAGTSVARRLGELTGANKATLCDHMTAYRARARIGHDDWERRYTCALVRNPWAQAVSWYHHHARQRIDLYTATDFRGWALRGMPTRWGDAYEIKGDVWCRPWRAYETHPLDARTYLTDPHTGRVIVDYVGRYEQLDEAWRTICDRLELGDVELGRHDHRGDYGDWRSHYDDATRAVVGERLRWVVERYGYTFDG